MYAAAAADARAHTQQPARATRYGIRPRTYVCVLPFSRRTPTPYFQCRRERVRQTFCHVVRSRAYIESFWDISFVSERGECRDRGVRSAYKVDRKGSLLALDTIRCCARARCAVL